MSKTILITGASRGIGRAVALKAAQDGWAVGVNYVRDKQAADAVVAAVAKLGARAVAVQGDVAEESELLKVFDETAGALGPLDGLVVNAGIFAPPQPLADMSAERLRRMFDVNTFGAFITAREGARRFAKSRGGRGGAIVLVSSIASRLGGANAFVDYAASKAAVDILGVTLAKELGPEGVRVNVVRPGIIDTDIHASIGEPDRPRTVGATAPLGRAGTAEEVAESITWLLSDAASYVTGAVLDVSGGR